MRHLLNAVVIATATLQGAVIGLFAVFALSGDSLGIAKAMVGILAIPFLILTLPSIMMARMGKLGIAVALAVASLGLTAAAWYFAQR
jgi:hypothetical protein